MLGRATQSIGRGAGNPPSVSNSFGSGSPPQPAIYSTPGTVEHVIPFTGLYDVAIWGAGGTGAHQDGGGNRYAGGGAAGGYCRSRRYLRQGTRLTCSIGAAVAATPSSNGNVGAAGQNTTITLPDGTAMTAGGGPGGNGGGTGAPAATSSSSASGGDVNIPGGGGGGTTAGGAPASGTNNGTPGAAAGARNAGAGAAASDIAEVRGGDGGGGETFSLTSNGTALGKWPGGGSGGVSQTSIDSNSQRKSVLAANGGFAVIYRGR